MPTYAYETIPQNEDEAPHYFEIYQSIHDEALKTDPESGLPVRRVISGGIEIPRGKADPGQEPPAAGGHSDSCACCHPRH